MLTSWHITWNCCAGHPLLLPFLETLMHVDGRIDHKHGRVCAAPAKLVDIGIGVCDPANVVTWIIR